MEMHAEAVLALFGQAESLSYERLMAIAGDLPEDQNRLLIAVERLATAPSPKLHRAFVDETGYELTQEEVSQLLQRRAHDGAALQGFSVVYRRVL